MRQPRWDPTELELRELEAALEARGVAPFHARQLYRWIHKRGVTDIDQMTDLSLALRAAIKTDCHLSTPKVVANQRSVDGTRKFALELSDSRRVEAVFIPDTPSMTFCISTQVGCAMGMRFLPDRQDGPGQELDGWRDRGTSPGARRGDRPAR